MTVTISSGGFRAKGQTRKWINAQHDSAQSTQILQKQQRKKNKKIKIKTEFAWKAEFFPRYTNGVNRKPEIFACPCGIEIQSCKKTSTLPLWSTYTTWIVRDLKNCILVFLVGSSRHGPLNKIKEPVRRALEPTLDISHAEVRCFEVIDIPCLESGQLKHILNAGPQPIRFDQRLKVEGR